MLLAFPLERRVDCGLCPDMGINRDTFWSVGNLKRSTLTLSVQMRALDLAKAWLVWCAPDSRQELGEAGAKCARCGSRLSGRDPR